MRVLRLVVCSLVLFSVAARQTDAADPAVRARELLGHQVWTRILRIKNERPGRGSSFPAEFLGLVFEFEGMLWLYTGLDGTRSLSLFRGRLAADEANPAPLLSALEPGLTGFVDVTGQVSAAADAGIGPLPHDCFIRCVARWQALQKEANPPVRGQLLACYAPSLPEGHTILEFWRAGHRYVFDPCTPARLKALPLDTTEDPVEVARIIFSLRMDPGPSKVLALELRPGGPRPESPQIIVSTTRARGSTSALLRTKEQAGRERSAHGAGS